jgi:hypothetical protein
MAPLYAGSLANFAGSMAEAIEQALDQTLIEAGFPPMPDPSTADKNDLNNRRILFLAIARGVINYLNQNEDAFQFSFAAGNHSHPIGSSGEHAHSGHVTIQVT